MISTTMNLTMNTGNVSTIIPTIYRGHRREKKGKREALFRDNQPLSTGAPKDLRSYRKPSIESKCHRGPQLIEKQPCK